MSECARKNQILRSKFGVFADFTGVTNFGAKILKSLNYFTLFNTGGNFPQGQDIQYLTCSGYISCVQDISHVFTIYVTGSGYISRVFCCIILAIGPFCTTQLPQNGKILGINYKLGEQE